MQKKKMFYPFDPLRALRVAQSPSGEAQPYLPHVTRRVPRSVHAKFHADWTKTVSARGIHTNRQTDVQSFFNYIDTKPEVNHRAYDPTSDYTNPRPLVVCHTIGTFSNYENSSRLSVNMIT